MRIGAPGKGGRYKLLNKAKQRRTASTESFGQFTLQCERTTPNGLNDEVIKNQKKG